MDELKNERKSRRAGGRAARHAERAAPLAEDLRPVRPGMTGGNYKPLTDGDIRQIHGVALDALEQIGMADAPDRGKQAMLDAGCTWNEETKRILFPRRLVEASIDMTPKEFKIYGQNAPEFDLTLSGNRVHYATAGAAVHTVDVDTKEYKESSLDDLYTAAKIVDEMDNIHFFQRPVVARDVLDNVEMDYNTMWACLRGTRKPIGTSIFEPDAVGPCFDMLYSVAGSEQAYRDRPFAMLSCTFVVPPMKYATESCAVMEDCIDGGMPVLLLSAGQAGATSPAAIAGSIMQAHAECLSGVVYVNALKQGHPLIFGPWPFVSDLRSGAMSGGSGEQSILSCGVAQMGQHIGLPTGTAAGMSDAKLPDIQAGYEKGITTVMAGLAGANMVYESAGMHASLLGFCLESLVIDNDMLGQAMRCVRGVEVDTSRLSLETMREVALQGPGHYLGTNQTMSLMQSEYIYPKIGDRLSPKEWAEVGKPDIVEEAKKKVAEVRAKEPTHIDPALDKLMREKYNIYVN